MGPALLRMPDIELLGVIRVMCETVGNKANNRKFYVHTRHAADSQNCSTNMGLQTKSDVDNARGDKTHILDYAGTNKTQMSEYFHSSDNTMADKRVSRAITNRMHNEFNDLFSGKG